MPPVLPWADLFCALAWITAAFLTVLTCVWFSKVTAWLIARPLDKFIKD